MKAKGGMAMKNDASDRSLSAGSRRIVPEENGWTCCGIPVNRGAQADFWTLWAQSRDSRKCSCGELVITGPCPVCGKNYGDDGRK